MSWYKKSLFDLLNKRTYCLKTLRIFCSMEQHVFYYFNDYRGHHRKGIAIYVDIGSDISIKSLKRKTKHQRRLQFNQRVKRAF